MHCKSYSHFFSKKFQHICVSLDVNFNESLTNDAVSFEQLGPDFFFLFVHENMLWILIRSEMHCQGASNEYPEPMFSLRNKIKIYLIPY